MKKFLFLLTTVMVALSVWAAPVDQNAASKVAKNYLTQEMYAGRIMAPAAVNPVLLKTGYAENAKVQKPVYYIFNTSTTYLVVAGDDRAEEILMVGDAPLEDINNLPLGMIDMLGIYAEQIQFLHEHPSVQVEKISEQRHNSLRAVTYGPLLTAKWDQDAPYWNLCKFTYNGKTYQCYTGCPATSAAMVLYYWKYPASVDALPSYTSTMDIDANNYQGYQTVNYTYPALEATTFNWANMKDSYSSYTSAQGAAVAGMSYLQKKNVKAQEVNYPSMISCWLGVTEPAMFGINLKYQWPFYCAMTGSCLAAVISTLFGVTAASIGVGGLPGIISIFPQFMLIFAIAMLVALVVPFVLTVMIGRNKINPETGELYSDEAEAAAEEAAEAAKAAGFTEAQKNETFVVPMSGTVMPVSEVDDQVFASKAMGDGIAIEPAEGKVYAPFSGEITVAFPTGHAYGLKAANGKEVLIHIGMDTVELDGKGFTPHVKQGDIVNQGDLLTDVDLDYIRSQGKPVVTPVIFTDGTEVELLKKGAVTAKDTDVVKLS